MGNDLDGEDGIDLSGYAVKLSGDGSTVIIGAPYNNDNGNDSGHVRIYRWDGTTWNKLGTDLAGERASDEFGFSVDISENGNIIAVGGDDNYGPTNSNFFAGHVQLYQWDGSAWTQLGNDIDAEASLDQYGWSVALNQNGTRIAVSAPENNGNGNDSGHSI